MKYFFAGMLMLILEPFLRLPEAFLRMHFLADYYGSFWNALMSDWFFSDGWFAYLQTPLGLWYNIFILVWMLIGLALIAVAFYSWQRQSRRLSEEISAISEGGADS